MIGEQTNKAGSLASLLPVSEAAASTTGVNEQLASHTPKDVLSEPQALPSSEQFLHSDEQLISAAQGGVSFALEELLIRHRETVYRAARHFFGSGQEAEDVVQETMLRAIRNIGKFRSEARFSSWLVAIAINTAISIKRKENRVHWVYLDEPMQLGDEPRAGSLPDNRRDPEQRCFDKELCNLVRRAVAKQRPKFQLILRWCDFEGVSVDQVAHRLGITSVAARSCLFRARQQLRGTVRRKIGESR